MEVANHLLKNHFIPKTWYSIGIDFVGEVTSLGGTKLKIGQSANGNFFINRLLTVFTYILSQKLSTQRRFPPNGSIIPPLLNKSDHFLFNTATFLITIISKGHW
jgi:hypothetical protein